MYTKWEQIRKRVFLVSVILTAAMLVGVSYLTSQSAAATLSTQARAVELFPFDFRKHYHNPLWLHLELNSPRRLAHVYEFGFFGLFAALMTAITGDKSAYMVSQAQPMKLAAMEALYEGGTDQSLTAIAWVNPLSQPDYRNTQEPPLRIGIPYALSFLATRDFHGYVPGVKNLLDGYTTPDGQKEPSAQEKIAMGKKAITTLAQYRALKKDAAFASNDSLQALAESYKATLADNMKYFGYGYIKNEAELVPNIPLCFYAFRVMVGLGCLFILFFAVTLFLAYRKEIARFKWLHVAAIILVPLGYIGSESGWIVAEMGRQPWTIQDMLPVGAAVSDIQSGSVALTFFIFLILFTAMLAVELSILFRQIQRGPEHAVSENEA